MNKHTATHDGQTFTRNSQGRTYTHVVIARTYNQSTQGVTVKTGQYKRYPNGYREAIHAFHPYKCAAPGAWIYLSWAGTPELAIKRVNEFQNRMGGLIAEIRMVQATIL